MAKQSYEVYKIGSNVYAIARYYKDGKPTNYISIFEAIVLDATIGYSKKTNTLEVSYMLTTPNGQEWGDVVDEADISDSFDALVERIKPVWLSKSNSFED